MIRVRCAAMLLGTMLLAAATGVHAASPPATIKDVDNNPVEVKSDGPKDANAGKTMESYRRFLDLNAGDAALRAEALRRLGDLNLESSEEERIERDLVTNEGLRAGEAITLYSALLKAYPKYERNDAVLYQLARAYELGGQPEKALASLDDLVAHYPSSRYLDEAQFRRGELLFSAQHYDQAQSAYEAVIKIGSASPFYRQSLYKHGWALFKQGDNEHSLDSFAGVLDSVLLSHQDPKRVIELETLSRPNRELVEDTFRVMSITFSYGDGSRSIDEFMRNHPARPYAYLLYARLGDLYTEKQRYTDAADTYRSFVAQDRNHEKAPLLQMQAIEAYKQGGFPQLVLQGKKEFVENYALKGAFFAGRDPKSERQVVAELKTNLKDVAQYYHAQAQKSKNTADFQQAAKWYRDYLTSFPDDPDTAVTNFLLADTLFESKQYQEAATEYEHTAYGYGAHERAAAAGYAAVVAYGKQEDSAPPEQKAAIHAQGLESALKFAATFPTHAEVPQVLTKSATELYAAKDYLRASSAAQKLLARRPPVSVTQQRVAWTVIANSNFDQGNFDQAEKAYSTALSLMPPNDPERAAIVERLAAAIYKQGEQHNKAGNGAAAVDDFLRVAQLAPTSKVRSNADFDAAALLIEQKQWDRAIAVLEGFRRNFPQSTLQPDVTRKLAVAYVEGGHPQQAAAEFERIAASPTESADVQREATLQAAELYYKGGDTAKSRSMLEAFVKHFPAPLDPAMEARNKLELIAEKSGDSKLADYWMKEIIAADKAAGPQRTDRSRALAAKATLAMAAPVREEFTRIKLVIPLKKSLAEKRKAMEAAIKAYSQAADYQVVEVTTAATYESAELYRQLAKDLMQSQRPKHLSKDELEQYEVLLEEQSIPFEDTAIKLHEVNTVRAKDGVYDESVQKSFASLAQLNPGRYNKVEIADNSAPAPASAAAATQHGIADRKLGRFKEAEAAYQQALAADPNYPFAHLDLGILYDLYLGRPQQALPEFERYAALSGGNKQLTGWIAELHKRTGIAATAPSQPEVPAPGTPGMPTKAPGSAAAPPAPNTATVAPTQPPAAVTPPAKKDPP